MKATCALPSSASPSAPTASQTASKDYAQFATLRLQLIWIFQGHDVLLIVTDEPPSRELTLPVVYRRQCRVRRHSTDGQCKSVEAPPTRDMRDGRRPILPVWG